MEDSLSVDGWEFSVTEDGNGIIIIGFNDPVKELKIPQSMTVDGREYPVTEIFEEAFLERTDFETVIFPDTLKNIFSGSFAKCTALKNVRIPRNAILEENPFSGCTSLERFVVDEDNQNYSVIDGVLMSKDGTELVIYPPGKGSNYVIPATVRKIADYAFDSSNISDITIGNNVVCIGS